MWKVGLEITLPNLSGGCRVIVETVERYGTIRVRILVQDINLRDLVYCMPECKISPTCDVEDFCLSGIPRPSETVTTNPPFPIGPFESFEVLWSLENRNARALRNCNTEEEKIGDAFLPDSDIKMVGKVETVPCIASEILKQINGVSHSSSSSSANGT